MTASSTEYRLRKHADYQRVYKATRKQHGKQMAYFAAARVPGTEAAQRSLTTGPRVGLTVPKALGPAVVRNRIKRRLRVAVRAALPLLRAPLDVVLHPRAAVALCAFDDLQREVSIIFRAVQAAAERGAGAPPQTREPQPARRRRSAARPPSAGAAGPEL